MNFSRSCSLLWLALTSILPPAQAGNVYSNLGPGESFYPGSAFGFGPILSTGDSFVVPSGQNYTLDGIDLALSTQDSLSGPGTTVLLTDTAVGGKPGTVLESFLTATIPPQTTPGILSVASAVHPVLLGGQQYFVILGGGPGGGWFYTNSTGDVGPVVNGDASGHYFLFTASKSAFRIDGSAIASVPEPGTMFLLFSSIISVVTLKRLYL